MLPLRCGEHSGLGSRALALLLRHRAAQQLTLLLAQPATNSQHNGAAELGAMFSNQKQKPKIRYTQKEAKDKAVHMLQGVRYAPLSGRRDQPAAIWVEDVGRLIEKNILLNGCDEAEKPALLWDVILRCVSDDTPADHSRSPRAFLKYRRTELLKSGDMTADEFPDFT
eukprot:COSAG01_NODE_23994_length_794_cov_2.152518_1_plen_168_part_00